MAERIARLFDSLFARFNRYIAERIADAQESIERREAERIEQRQAQARAAEEKAAEAERKKWERIGKMSLAERSARGIPIPVSLDLSASEQYQEALEERALLKEGPGFNVLALADPKYTMFEKAENARKALITRLAMQGFDASVIAPRVGWPVEEVVEYLKSKGL